MGLDWMESVFPAIFIFLFAIVVGSLVWAAISGIKIRIKNNNSPRLIVDAKVISKRMNVLHHRYHHAGNITGAHGHHTTAATLYYVSFELESGDRTELPVSGAEYGMLAEGDVGRLKFQGTRYLAFEKTR